MLERRNRGVLLKLTEAPPPRIFKGDTEFAEIGVFITQELLLCVLSASAVTSLLDPYALYQSTFTE